jgi:hypothetical protein
MLPFMKSKWFIPIYKDKNNKEYIALGSDGAFYSEYVRRDKVRNTVLMVANHKHNGNKAVAVYAISQGQFWDLNWHEPEVLRKYGYLVYENGCRGF